MQHRRNIPRVLVGALTIALAIAAKAGWSMERAGSDLPAPHDAHFYVRSAELLVVPTALMALTLLEARNAALPRNDSSYPSDEAT